jgi:MFS family permease
MISSRRFLWLYYGFQFFFNLLLWFPVYYEFQKRIGLDDPQIFRIQTIYYLAFCVLEIPTGYLADRWGRRPCMRAGAIVLTLGNLLPVFVQSYAGFLAHFLLIGLSRSLISGASSAYLYDYLAQAGDAAAFKEVEGRARAYGLVGKVLCWAGIGVLMEWRLELPYILTALSSAVSIAFAFWLPPLPGTASQPASRASKGFCSDLRPVMVLLRSTPRLLLLMLQGVSIFVLARICQVNLFQPILTEKHFPLAAFGLILAVNTVFEALGSAYPNVLRRWFDDLSATSLLSIVLGLSLSLIAWSGQAGAIVWLTVFALCTGLSYPIQRQLLNDAIPDPAYRATLLSLESLIDRAVCAGVAALIGSYVASGRLDVFLHYSNVAAISVTVAITGVLLLMRDRRPATRDLALAGARRGVGTEELL